MELNKDLLTNLQCILKKVKNGTLLFHDNVINVMDKHTYYQFILENSNFTNFSYSVDIDAIKKIKTIDIFDLNFSEDVLIIKSGNKTYKIPAVRKNLELPAIEFSSKLISMQFEELKNAYKKVKPAISKDCLRPNMQCIFLDSKNKKIVSTDSRRLHMQDIDFNSDSIKTEYNFSIHSGILDNIINILSCKTVDFYKNVTVLKFFDYSIVIDNKENYGQFPNYTTVIPEDKSFNYFWNLKEVDVKKTSTDLKELADVAKPEKGNAEFHTTSDKVIGLCSSPKFGIFEIEFNKIEVKTSEKQVIKFTVKYLIDAISQCQGDITFSFIASDSQLLISDNSGFKAIVMPIKL